MPDNVAPRETAMAHEAKTRSIERIRFEQSLYCPDTNCVPCKELRKMQDYIRSSQFTVGPRYFPKPKAGGTGEKSITACKADFHSDLKRKKGTTSREEYD